MDLARLFETEAAALKRFLTRFGRAVSVEDVAQDAFVRLCAANQSEIASPRAYLFATARNLALDSVRRNKAAIIESVADIERSQTRSGNASPEELVIEAEEDSALGAAIAALPPLERDALLLRRVERLPPAEVARRLGITERRMQRLVERAIARCHARLVSPAPRENNDARDNPSSID